MAVNGVVYERFQKGSNGWHERVAKSTFAKFPKFGRADRGHICLQDHGDEVAYRSIKVRALPARGAAIPFEDGTAAVAAVPAFPEATWEGWSPESEDGTPVVPLRPVVVTNAGDGSGRRFVLDQAGMIHVFKPGSVAGSLFLDLRPGTSPWGKYNEEGLLGLAFHPRLKDNGEFFVTYSLKGEKRVERLARFKVSRTAPDRADPASEELVLAVDQPFWNHNGGSIAFGPDGFLYWGLGDGGSRDDPFGNGEIDIVTKGGNYGWSVREGTRPFGNRSELAGKLVDPVWEYDHQVGKSITGGFVYRGKAIPELVGERKRCQPPKMGNLPVSPDLVAGSFFAMPEVGLEPTRPCGQRTLRSFEPEPTLNKKSVVSRVSLGNDCGLGKIPARSESSRNRSLSVHFCQLWVRTHSAPRAKCRGSRRTLPTVAPPAVRPRQRAARRPRTDRSPPRGQAVG